MPAAQYEPCNEPFLPAMQMFVDAFQAAIMACKGEYVRGSPMAQRLDRLCFESGVLLRNMPAKNHQTRHLRNCALRPQQGWCCSLTRNVCRRRAALHCGHFAPVQKVQLPPSCLRSDQQRTGMLVCTRCLPACCCSAPSSKPLTSALSQHDARWQPLQQSACGHEHTRFSSIMLATTEQC